jgi:O-antigen/teichoic acid export membrane protein
MSLTVSFKYLDRLLINNLFNAESVAIFFAGTISSQLLSIPLNIISIVLFSYISRVETLKRELIKKLLIILPFICIIIFFANFLISPLILKLLYSNYYELSIRIFYITNIGFSLMIIEYVLRGIVIKTYRESTKFIIDLIPNLLFIITSILLSSKLGLNGIAYSLTISIVIKSLITYIMVVKIIKERS